jgi:hypothetical protein
VNRTSSIDTPDEPYNGPCASTLTQPYPNDLLLLAGSWQYQDLAMPLSPYDAMLPKGLLLAVFGRPAVLHPDNAIERLWLIGRAGCSFSRHQKGGWTISIAEFGHIAKPRMSWVASLGATTRVDAASHYRAGLR